MDFNGTYTRDFTDRKDLSFLLKGCSVDNVSGEASFSINGEGETLEIKFKEGKIYDFNGSYLGSYEPLLNLEISGDISKDHYNFSINGQSVTKGIDKNDFKIENFSISTTNSVLTTDLYVYGDLIDYTITAPSSIDSGELFNISMSNDSTDARLHIYEVALAGSESSSYSINPAFLTQIDYGQSMDFMVQCFPNAKSGRHELDLEINTNIGKITKTINLLVNESEEQDVLTTLVENIGASNHIEFNTTNSAGERVFKYQSFTQGGQQSIDKIRLEYSWGNAGTYYKVTGVEITDIGYGYLGNASVTFLGTGFDSQASGDVVMDAWGKVDGVNVNYAGSYFNDYPTIVFEGEFADPDDQNNRHAQGNPLVESYEKTFENTWDICVGLYPDVGFSCLSESEESHTLGIYEDTTSRPLVSDQPFYIKVKGNSHDDFDSMSVKLKVESGLEDTESEKKIEEISISTGNSPWASPTPLGAALGWLWPPTVTPTCELTEIFNHIKENIDTAAHGVFLGEAHGIASISNWIADHVATLLPTDGAGVLFMEAMYSDDQLILDAYQNTDDPRYGSIEHCDLLGAMARSEGLEAMCCSEAWDPDNFHYEYARIVEACVANDIKVIGIDVDGTMAVRNAHWASVINDYLISFPNHKFIIHGGAGHTGGDSVSGTVTGVDELITGKTVISYDFMTPGWGGAWPNFYDCDGVLDSGGGSTSLGSYETSPCMCLRGCYDGNGTGCNSDYVIWINDCAEPTYSCSDPQYTTQETCEAAVETWLTFEKYVNYNCSVIPSVGSTNHSGNGGFNPGEQIIPVLCQTTPAPPTTTPLPVPLTTIPPPVTTTYPPSACCFGQGVIEARECTVGEMSTGGGASGNTIYICDSTVAALNPSNGDFAVVTVCATNAQICVEIIETTTFFPPAATAEIYALCSGTQAGEYCDCNTCGT